METIQGLTNWRLTVKRNKDDITVIRAVTCDKRAVLPDEICGLPVTRLSDRALAAGAPAAEGEELIIIGGPEAGEWDNRNITELTLPYGLQSAGDYAFMNLRCMETLKFYDNLQSAGSASFMNCRCFSHIELTRTGIAQGPALASIVRSLQQELDVTIHGLNGSVLRLVFPEYIENYTENSPAHHFELKISGGGYAYHGVFRDKALAVFEYDALWRDYISAEHDEQSALRLACWRLCYPLELSERAKKQYGEYLSENIEEAVSFALNERNTLCLRTVLSLGRVETHVLEKALNEARRQRMTEATAILLEKKHGSPASGRNRNFAL